MMENKTSSGAELFDPSPARLVESLRDTGYLFTTAVADIIDNSIVANATKVFLQVDVEFDGRPRLMICDNGDGMSEEELKEAMRYGSPKRPNPKSLGKFGIGLKTASTSFCRCLTVASRSKSGTLVSRQWDLDIIINDNKWNLLTPVLETEDVDFFEKTTEGGSGTIVIWDKVDRLTKPDDKTPPRKQIETFIEELRLHLSAVFGRFLDNGNDGTKNIHIFINGEEILNWDPFCGWLNGVESDKTRLEVIDPVSDEIISHIILNSYILPNRNQMTNEEEEKARYGLENQGFYVYRENRLIYSGGWLNRIFTKEPHMNLLRVELSFTHELDEHFQIDIKKSRIVLPQFLKEAIRKRVTPFRREAARRYREGSKKKTDDKGSDSGVHAQTSNVINKHSDDAVNSLISNIDDVNNTATVRNKYGELIIKIPVERESNISIYAVENLPDGILWNYAIVNGKHAVQLNKSHEFYKRFYTAAQESPILGQAMDMLFWSLAEAELSCISKTAQRNLEEMRFTVSRTLRLLAEDLPEVVDYSDDEL